MNTLFLTAEEQKTFGALPAKLREGWTVHAEQEGNLRDDAAHRAMRLQLVHLHDPKLKEFIQRGSALTDAHALAEFVASADLHGVEDGDLAELCFALGPVPLSGIIAILLAQAKHDDDVEGIQALALIRHSLLVAMVSPARS